MRALRAVENGAGQACAWQEGYGTAYAREVDQTYYHMRERERERFKTEKGLSCFALYFDLFSILSKGSTYIDL